MTLFQPRNPDNKNHIYNNKISSFNNEYIDFDNRI